jgi:hypothetical protein
MPGSVHPTLRGVCEGCRSFGAVRPYTRQLAGRFRLCSRCHPDAGAGSEAR